MVNADGPSATSESLCRQCTLCCSGVLFVDVHLSSPTESSRLEKEGVELEWDQEESFLPQPCQCLNQQGDCRVYPQRPGMCSAFECSLLKDWQRGDLSTYQTLSRIKEARNQVASVESLLDKLGQRDASMPLFFRTESVLSQPWDLEGQADVNQWRDQLFDQSASLSEFLDRHFLRELDPEDDPPNESLI